MIIEEFANIVEIRPNRFIYLRKVILCSNNKNNNNKNNDIVDTTTTTTSSNTTTCSTSTETSIIIESSSSSLSLQMIFVHGICGTQQQFQSLLLSINEQLYNNDHPDDDDDDDNDNDDEQKSSLLSSSSSRTTTNTTTTTTTGSIVCWLYDQVGCGQSPLPFVSNNNNYNDYNSTETQADLEALLHLQQQHSDDFPTPSNVLPTIMVGHSYGPSIFVPLLSSSSSFNNNPQQQQQQLLPNLMGMILIGTSVRDCKHLSKIPDGGNIMIRILPICILQCIQSYLTEQFIEMAVHKKHTTLRDTIRMASQNNNMYIAKYYHYYSKWMTLVQLQEIVLLNHRRRRHKLSSSSSLNQSHPESVVVQLPTLIIHGMDDQITPIECGQYLYNQLLQLPSSSSSSPNNNNNNNKDPTTTNVTFVTIEEASHMVMMEQPQQTAHAIIQFIQQHSLL